MLTPYLCKPVDIPEHELMRNLKKHLMFSNKIFKAIMYSPDKDSVTYMSTSCTRNIKFKDALPICFLH